MKLGPGQAAQAPALDPPPQAPALDPLPQAPALDPPDQAPTSGHPAPSDVFALSATLVSVPFPSQASRESALRYRGNLSIFIYHSYM